MSGITFTNINNGDSGGVVREAINNNFLAVKESLNDLTENSVKVITYTGDGASKRLLPVGFTPKFALVFCVDRNVYAFKTIYGSHVHLNDVYSWYTSYNCADDGIYVGLTDSGAGNNSSTNVSGKEYVAVCWR